MMALPQKPHLQTVMKLQKLPITSREPRDFAPIRLIGGGSTAAVTASLRCGQ